MTRQGTRRQRIDNLDVRIRVSAVYSPDFDLTAPDVTTGTPTRELN